MGLSSNQARFLSLTSRQIDMEQRIQQICQRRLRLSSELENVATSYNNSISNRKMFTASQTNDGIQDLSLKNLDAVGYKIIDNDTNIIIGQSPLVKQVLSASAVPSGAVGISSAAELQNALNTNPAGNYILMGNIDLSSLGTLSNSLVSGNFTGSLDGNGYEISNLKIAESSAKSTSTNVHTGLFSNLGVGANISNLILKDCNVTTSDTLSAWDTQEASRTNTAGILTGFISGATIDNVTVVNSTVNTDHAAGGLAGIMSSGSVTNCSTSGSVTGACFTGGLIGQIQGGGIDICNSSATVQGDNYVGGLVGESLTSGHPIVSRSYATGDVSGINEVGGLMGRNHNAVLQDCYTTGDVSGSNYVGGICGDNMDNPAIINSYASGNTSGSFAVGGLVGSMLNVGSITNSFWLGNAGVASNASGTLTNVQHLASMADLGVAAKASGWGNNPNEFAQTPLTGSGGSWNTSTTPPTLYTPTGYEWTPDKIEENLRSGRFSLVTSADEYTQDPISVGGKSYEKKDWRTVPQIDDELNSADDAAAENKYDATIAEINSQDKKLQLEQTSIETEYKAVSSEREAVKKILDTNASSSFKYFS